ncbi:MAG: TonB-dependent receptor [Acidobacteria bacterium]|nr:TonB-dependent receptor [Acidobacteriota bacterium]
MKAQTCQVGWVRFTLATLTIFTFTGLLHAQVESAKIVGTVRDASGAVLPGAKVTVTNVGTNVTRSLATDNGGNYVVTELRPGTYTVTVTQPGFKAAVQSPFQLDVNQVLRVDLTLAVGNVSERVEVTAAEPLVESQTSSMGQVIEEQRVHELPLNGRNFVQLAYLTPGVNQGPNAGLTVQQGNIPEDERGNAAIQANGLTATNNNFLLNGFDNNEQQIGIEVIQPSIDAIQEFKVQTNNFGADIGRGGAVVNAVLKSGSNQFHGSAYEFLRNSIFDAKNYFDDPSLPIAPFKRNQFGATLGGPMMKNRTFFFGDYEGTRIRQSLTDISTVPVPGERGGDFSDLLTGTIDPVTGFDNGQIFDPLTYDAATNSRQPFVGNIIPACLGNTHRSATGGGCLDPVALNLVQLFPAPNRPGAANNYLSNPVLSNNQDTFDIRIDHQVSPQDSFFATFSYGNVKNHRPDPFPGIAGGGTFSGNVKNLARTAGISDVHTFSATKINEFKISYSRYVVEAIPNFAGQPLSAEVGIPGIFDAHNAFATGGLPFFYFSSLSSIGTTDWFPEILRENNYQLLDAFTYVRNRHSFKLGADLRLRTHGFFQTQNSRGDLTFDQQFTAAPQDGSGGSDLASFLLGYPISAFRDGQKGSFGMSWWEISAYFMDDFRVSPRLTLNLGLRYDVFTPNVEQHDRLANFNFATGQFVAPGMPGVSRSGNVVTDLNNFAPRFGFAWSPWSDKTALRGGFGIFYDIQANQNDAQLAYNPTGLFFSQNFNNPPTSPDVSLSLSTGYPAPTYPTLANPSGRASAAFFNNRTSYIEEWNLNVERALSNSMVLQIGYVGTHGVKLAQLANQNQPVLPLDTNFCGLDLNNCNQPSYGRPYFLSVPNIGPIRAEGHNVESISHGLQLKFEKRFSKGWSMLDSYTWQHTIGQTEENEYLEPQNTHNPAGERGNNGPDYRHQFTSAWSYELPFGPHQRFFTRGPVRWLSGGWQLNGIIAMYSGEAFTPLLSFDPTNTGSGAPRPDIIGDPYNFANATSVGCPTNSQTLECWYNPLAFAVPALAPGQSNAHLFGNARRGILRGPAEYNVDFSIFKDFTFSENKMLQFRAEFFNLFNTPEFGLPNAAVDQTGTPGSPGLAGSISNTIHAPRQIQLALRFTF